MTLHQNHNKKMNFEIAFRLVSCSLMRRKKENRVSMRLPLTSRLSRTSAPLTQQSWPSTLR